jgi:hypothetical protein
MWELSKVFVAFCLLNIVLLGGCVPLSPAGRVKDQMQPLLDYLDSDAYAVAVPWEVHVVLAYQAAQGRLPSLAEYAIIEGLRGHVGIKRSEVLGLALAGDSDDERLDSCRALLANKSSDAFTPNPDAMRAARQLADATPAMVRAVLQQPALEETEGEEEGEREIWVPAKQHGPDVEYECYFGYLHAHSHLSLDADDAGTARRAYAAAREAGMDFFSLTDHAEFLLLWPWEKKYDQLKAAANAANAPGEFAALYGFEWSNPLLGHVSVLNTMDYTHSLRNFRLRGLYNWIANRPQAFAQMNHPGDYDALRIEFLRFLPHPRVTRQIVGIETWNSGYGFDDYFYDGSWGEPITYLDRANQMGWRLGALGAQDNHHGDWGTLNDFRTGVLATELTREAISEAFRARRFYATEDKDLLLDFRCNGYPMGSVLTDAGDLEFSVTLGDRSGDDFQLVRLFRNGALIDSRAVSGNNLTIEFSDSREKGGFGRRYYYVIATQTDDNNNDERNDEAISSPIWIDN